MIQSTATWLEAHGALLICGVFCAVGLFMLGYQFVCLRKAVFVTGQFKIWTKDEEHLWKPIVVFITTDGQEREFESKSGFSMKGQWEAGDPVTVVYDPARPENAQVYSFLYFWALPFIFLAFGIIGLSTAH